jgi:ribulose-5-phosphate 4-epimerase/fuculose-1-phosphate aldolase
MSQDQVPMTDPRGKSVWPTICSRVVETTLELARAGLIYFSAGNVSARVSEGLIAITPSRQPYQQMTVDDIVIVDALGRVVWGRRQPSSETPMHLAVYKHLRTVGAVIHTHSSFAIAFASTGGEIPVSSLEILSIGGPVPVSGFAPPGSELLGETAVQAFSKRSGLKAILLRNHGSLVIGADLDEALGNAMKLEKGAKAYHLALQLEGKPLLLTNEQIAESRKGYLELESESDQ